MTLSPREFVDYAHEVKLVSSPFVRFILVSLAPVFLVLGIVGIFVPLLPTTPFILLASACYARSSTRFYNWLMNHPRLGPPLRRWKENRAITRKNKVIAISLIALTLIPTIALWIPVIPVKYLLAFIGISVSFYIASRKEA